MKLAAFWIFGFVSCQLVGLVLQLTDTRGWMAVLFSGSVSTIGYLLILLFSRERQ